MLVLVNPLVEVGLQEVDLRRILQQSWPELILRLLLSQDQCDVLCSMVDLGLLLVDLAPEGELEVVIALEGVGVAGEGKRLRLDVELDIRLLDVGHADGQVDDVLGLVGAAGALSPKNYAWLALAFLQLLRAQGDKRLF